MHIALATLTFDNSAAPCLAHKVISLQRHDRLTPVTPKNRSILGREFWKQMCHICTSSHTHTHMLHSVNWWRRARTCFPLVLRKVTIATALTYASAAPPTVLIHQLWLPHWLHAHNCLWRYTHTATTDTAFIYKRNDHRHCPHTHTCYSFAGATTATHSNCHHCTSDN